MRLNAIPTTICGIPSQIWCLSPFWSFGLYRFHSYNSCRYRTFLRLGAHRHLCRQLAKQHAADAAGLQAAAKEAQKREVATLVDAQAHVAATYADARAAEDDAMIAATASALESGCEVERALQCKHDLKVCLEQEVVAAHARCAPPPLDRKNHQENHDADYEDATIAHLHAQVATVQNIKAPVPITADLWSPHYKWCGHILLMLSRYTLSDHVLSNAATLNVPVWYHMDCTVLSWLSNSIMPDLMEAVHERGRTTARFAWLVIEQQFLKNRENHSSPPQCQVLQLSFFDSILQLSKETSPSGTTGLLSSHEGHG